MAEMTGFTFGDASLLTLAIVMGGVALWALKLTHRVVLNWVGISGDKSCPMTYDLSGMEKLLDSHDRHIKSIEDSQKLIVLALDTITRTNGKTADTLDRVALRLAEMKGTIDAKL